MRTSRRLMERSTDRLTTMGTNSEPPCCRARRESRAPSVCKGTTSGCIRILQSLGMARESPLPLIPGGPDTDKFLEPALKLFISGDSPASQERVLVHPSGSSGQRVPVCTGQGPPNKPCVPREPVLTSKLSFAVNGSSSPMDSWVSSSLSVWESGETGQGWTHTAHLGHTQLSM